MIPIRDTAPCNSTPYVTWGIMAVCIVIFLVMQLLPFEVSNRLLYFYGMVPLRYADPEWARMHEIPFDGYLSFFTGLFLHGGWIHLIFNMWFLWIFGDNVEDSMGKGRFFAFYVLCGILAMLMQWYNTPYMDIPVVGASGAIAGVLAAYYFLYPFERVVVYFFPVVLHLPAIGFLGLWVIFQLYQITTTTFVPGVETTSAWWAHMGGFIAGGILYRFFLRKDAAV